MAKKQPNFAKKLQEWLVNPAHLLVAGIGNPIKSDDSVGVKIIHRLQSKTSSKINLLECETVPESFIDEIAEYKPTHVLLIDAAMMDSKPGKVCLFEADEIADFQPTSTHLLPLPVFCELVAKLTGAKVALLLIEPKNMEIGEDLTPEVEKSAEKVVQALLKLLP